MWSPITTPKHGKISYSKDAKEEEEEEEEEKAEEDEIKN